MAQIRRRGPNRYLISLYLGRDAQGKRKYHNEYFHGTKTEAQQRAAELHLALKRRRGPASLAMTVGEYLKSWLEKIEGTVSERSFGTYAYHVKRLVPMVGQLSLYELTAFELQTALGKLKGCPKTIKDSFGVLKTALRQAVAWGLLNTDPTAGLRAPRVPRKEKKVLTPGELEKLLEAAEGYKHYPVIRLLAVTGARLGEVLGLSWKDIDFMHGTVTIRRAVNTRKRKLKETKTAASERTLKIDEKTLEVLKLLKRQQEQNRKVIKLKPEEYLIFTAPDGRPVKDSAVRKTLRLALKKAGLGRMKPHDFRHTAGSLLLDAGYSLPVVAAFLGHSSPATTAAIYAHAVRKGANVVDALKDADRNADLQKKNP